MMSMKLKIMDLLKSMNHKKINKVYKSFIYHFSFSNKQLIIITTVIINAPEPGPKNLKYFIEVISISFSLFSAFAS